MLVSHTSREGISLAEFVPRDVALTLSQGKGVPASAMGTILFVDIARFSTLASTLVAQYRATEGAERLSSLLEQVYTELISTVHAQSGSVIGFSGDAMTCWFATPLEGDARVCEPAALRALAAARAMRAALLKLDLGNGVLAGGERLAARFCIAAGETWRTKVGAPNFQRFSVIGGPPLARVALAGELALPGQILLDVAAAAEVGNLTGSSVVDEFVVAGMADGEPLTPETPHATANLADADGADVSESVLLEWVPHGARERLRQTPEFLATFKPVVAVFIQFGSEEANEGGTLDAATVTHFVNQAQVVFESYGGRLVDITVGEKGSYLFAVFGDLRVHEDDCRRALLAVLALKSEGATQLGGLSVGIARGPAYAGLIGGLGRRTFGVIGLEVTLAARLMVAARSDEILVASSVSQILDSEFEFANRREAVFKGFAEPVAVSSMVSKRETSRWVTHSRAGLSVPPVLFGRESDIAELSAAIDRLLVGVGGIVELTGEPGIGKSTVLRVAAARAEAAGVVVLTGAGSALSAGAFSLWSDILPEVANPSEQNLESALSAAGRAERVADELVTALCAMAAAKPLLFSLENLQWADSESLRVLRQFAIAAPRALIVTTSRDNAIYLESGLTPSSWVTRRLELEALPATAIQHLIAATLGARSVATPILDFIVQQADGSPLFANELALALRDSGVVRVTRDHAQLRDATTVLDTRTSSETVQSIIAARIDDLPPFEQIVVKAASVIGRRFAPTTLAQAVVESLGSSDSDVAFSDNSDVASREGLKSVALALASLANREILQVVDSDGNYAFRHALAQQVAYGTLLHEHRARLHLRVAEGLELDSPIDSTQELQLAHHWCLAATGLDSASATDRALYYLQRAGERALNLSAHSEALSCFTRALELALQNQPLLGEERLANWHASSAAAHLGLGRFEDCAQSCSAALDCLGYSLPRRPGLTIPLELFRQLGRRILNRGFRGAVAVVDTQGNAERKRLQQASEVLRILSKSYFFSNDAIPSAYANLRNMNLSEQLGPGTELALSYTTTQLTLGVLGRHSWAQAYGLESLSMAESVDTFASRATLYLNNAVYRLSIGDWQQARMHASSAETQAKLSGDFAQLSEAVAVRADVDLFTGNTEASSELYRRLFIEAERRGRWLEQAWSVRPEAQRALRAGRHEMAIELLDRHLGVLAPLNDPLIAIDVHGMHALAFARNGAHALAREAATKALTLVERVSPPVAYPRYLGLVALVEALLLLDVASAREAGRSKLEWSTATRRAMVDLAAYARVFPFAQAASEMFYGWVAASRCKQRKAEEHLVRARAVAENFAFAYEEARVCAMLSTVSSNPQLRERCTAVAVTRFEELAVGASARQLENYLVKEPVDKT